MTHREYVDACQRTELKDMPARLLNEATGEVGMQQHCVWLEAPEGLLVKTPEGAGRCGDYRECEELVRGKEEFPGR